MWQTIDWIVQWGMRVGFLAWLVMMVLLIGYLGFLLINNKITRKTNESYEDEVNNKKWGNM